MSDTQQAQRDIWIEQQITAMRFDGITTDAAILRAYLMAAYEKGQADAHREWQEGDGGNKP